MLFLGTLEVFRLISVKQSLRTGLKMAIPCVNHWRDGRNQCDPYQRVIDELRDNPFTVRIYRLEFIPNADSMDQMLDGQVFQVTAVVDVNLGFLYPFEGGPTITLRESAHTFIDSYPSFYGLNAATPFPNDPGVLPR